MIPGLELVPLAESEICCGAAGSYNLTQPEMADRLGQRKAKNILDTGAQARVHRQRRLPACRSAATCAAAARPVGGAPGRRPVGQLQRGDSGCGEGGHAVTRRNQAPCERCVPATMVLTLLLAGSLRAAEPVDYLREVKPLLAARCYACHGALQQKADLRLDTASSCARAATAGPAVVPGKSGRQPADRPRHRQRRQAAHAADRARARRFPRSRSPCCGAWIDQGADGPADEKPEADPQDHWAFRAPVRRRPSRR